MATDQTFNLGDKVEARTRDGWTDAKIVTDNGDGTYNVLFTQKNTAGDNWKASNMRLCAPKLSSPFRRMASLNVADEGKPAEKSPVENRFEDLFAALTGRSKGGGCLQGARVSGKELADVLTRAGILEGDNRMEEVFALLREEGGEWRESISEEDAKALFLNPNVPSSLLFSAFAGKLAVPDFEGFCTIITDVYNKVNAILGDRENPEGGPGANADYIPQLNEDNVDPNQFGISVCTVDGQRFNIGDTDRLFCVQSTSKPLSYLMASEAYGEDFVKEHVGCEPSGHAFNEMVLKTVGGGDGGGGHGAPGPKKIPHNPMINAGAIMACSMVFPEEETEEARIEKALQVWERLCGDWRAEINKEVYLSEAKTADRNWCLAYMMKECKAFPEEFPSGNKARWGIRDTLNFYFQQCSIEVTNDRSAVVAATLANGGLNPLTNDRIFDSTSTQHALSLMQCCGMYDYSGTWAYNVGVPSKSGVGGSVMIAIPNVCGISIWSPRLDDNGNSVRGVRVAEELGKVMKFHPFDMDDKKLNITLPKDRIKHSSMQDVMFAVSSDDIHFLRAVASKGTNLNFADYDQRTALHIASAEGRSQIVQFLIDNKGDVNASDRWGGYPLDDAKSANGGLGHPSVVAILEANGAKTSSKAPKMKWTYVDEGSDATKTAIVATLYAAADNDVSTLTQLSAQNVNLFLPDYDLRTSLHLAASNGQENALLYLLKQYNASSRSLNGDAAELASKEFEDRWGATARDDAVREGHEGCVKIWDDFQKA